MEAMSAGPATFIYGSTELADTRRNALGRGLAGFVRSHLPEIEATISASLPVTPFDDAGHFNRAVREAIFPGGKRLRPILTLLGAELFGGLRSHVLPAAAAVEFIHTSSLIFDDLPSMDNAESRRGRQSLHRKYGDSVATLVAISFLNESYRLVSTIPAADGSKVLAAIGEMTECVGPAGMVGGQALDLGSAPVTRAGLDELKNRKTSGLIRLALNLGAILSGADAAEIAALSRFAEVFGNAYQKSDDLIDLFEDQDRRTAAASASWDVPTAAQLRRDLEECVSEGKDVLAAAFSDSTARCSLVELLDYTIARLD